MSRLNGDSQGYARLSLKRTVPPLCTMMSCWLLDVDGHKSEVEGRRKRLPTTPQNGPSLTEKKARHQTLLLRHPKVLLILRVWKARGHASWRDDRNSAGERRWACESERRDRGTITKLINGQRRAVGMQSGGLRNGSRTFGSWVYGRQLRRCLVPAHPTTRSLCASPPSLAPCQRAGCCACL